MTERLDRIEALLERTAEQQARHVDEIDTLLGAIAQTDRQVRDTGNRVDALVVKIDESNQRFETLRNEARADRLETRALWNDAVVQMQNDREESSRRFDAQQEVIQRLLIELVEMNRDNRRLRDRFDNLEQAS